MVGRERKSLEESLGKLVLEGEEGARAMVIWLDYDWLEYLNGKKEIDESLDSDSGHGNYSSFYFLSTGALSPILCKRVFRLSFLSNMLAYAERIQLSW